MKCRNKMDKEQNFEGVKGFSLGSFAVSWEQRKLGEVGKARSGVGFPDTEQGGTIGVPFFKVSDMNSDGNENEMTVANNYVTAEQIAAHRWSPIEELPALFFAKVGAAVMLNRKRLCRFPFLLDNNTMAYSLSSTEWDADFAKALFETIDLTSLVQVGALPSYNAGDVEAMEISMPSLSEQGPIGEFFMQLDNLITLHQRKYDKLQVLKKAMLEKMFPKNGSSVPEIRFKGFTDAWEQRKVSEVAEICAGGTPSTGIEKYWHPKEIPWLSSGEVHKKYITYTDNKISVEGLNNSSARMIPANSVLIALAGQGKTRGTVAINRISLTTNQSIAAMIFTKEIVPEFVFCNLENRYEEIRRMSSGDGSRGGLNKQIVGEIEIPYTSKEEQAKIGAYFSKLDYLITLHQRELEKLQNIKKSMLEKMFV